MSAALLNPLLDNIAQLVKAAPLRALLGLHCLYATSLFGRISASKWLLSFWIVFFGAFGGGTVTSYLMYEPPALFKTADIFLIFAIVWYLANYTPVGTFYNRLAPVQIASKAACNLLKAKTITSVIDKAFIKSPGVFAAPLVLGTLAGCGGKLSSDLMMKFFGMQSETELDSPGVAMRTSIASALLYAALTKYLALFTPLRAEALLIAVLVVHGVAEDVLRKSIDLTEPVFGLLAQLTGVPLVPGRKSFLAASRSRAASPVTSPKGRRAAMSPSRKSK